MGPDADAGTAAGRADPFAPLTSEMLDVGDGHAGWKQFLAKLDEVLARGD